MSQTNTSKTNETVSPKNSINDYLIFKPDPTIFDLIRKDLHNQKLILMLQIIITKNNHPLNVTVDDIIKAAFDYYSTRAVDHPGSTITITVEETRFYCDNSKTRVIEEDEYELLLSRVTSQIISVPAELLASLLVDYINTTLTKISCKLCVTCENNKILFPA